MNRRPHALFALPFVLAACAGPAREAATVQTEAPLAIHVPSVEVTPHAWETAGSSYAPTVRLLDEPRGEDLELVFRYVGEGRVRVPSSVIIPAGATHARTEPFVAEPASKAGQGTVQVLWPNPMAGEVLVAEWTVVHSPRIIEALDFVQEDMLANPDQWAASYAVIIDLTEPDATYAEAVREGRELQLEAHIDRQGKFQPDIRIERNVTFDTFPNLPREIALGGDRFVAVVSVAHPTAPALKRAFLKLTATVNGHSVTKHIALRL